MIIRISIFTIVSFFLTGCVEDAGEYLVDKDGDGVVNALDNCDEIKNSNQRNHDGDSRGDVCDDDDDNDGVLDLNDAFPFDASESRDTDGDGIGNNADADDDGDGVPDEEDFDSSDSALGLDTDGDGIPNELDINDDNDPRADEIDAFPLDPTEWLDSDGDGVGDNADGAPFDPTFSIDTDGDLIPDPWELTYSLDPELSADGLWDSDLDGVPNYVEFVEGTSPMDAEDYVESVYAVSIADQRIEDVEILWGAQSPIASDYAGNNVLVYTETNIYDFQEGRVPRLYLKNTADGSLVPICTEDDHTDIFYLCTEVYSISGDGKKVAFSKRGTDSIHVTFIKDMESLEVTPLMPNTESGEYFESSYAVFSKDARYVAFSAFSLIEGFGEELLGEVVIKDFQTGEIYPVSVTSDGVYAEGASRPLSVTPDGSHILFTTNSNNLLDEEVVGHKLYVKNIHTGKLSLVNVTQDGIIGETVSGPGCMSDDGSKVVFKDFSKNYFPDANIHRLTYYKDLTSGTLEVVNLFPYDTHQSSFWARDCISADGRFVAFIDQIPEDGRFGDGRVYDALFIKDMETGNIRHVDVNSAGESGNSGVLMFSMGRDATSVFFVSHATSLSYEFYDQDAADRLYKKVVRLK